MPPKKSAMTLGLEKILNNKDASPLTNPQVFRQIVSQSGKSLSETLKYVGKQSKVPRVSDEDKSKARLEKLESASEEKSKP
jgi:hypothetical protein